MVDPGPQPDYRPLNQSDFAPLPSPDKVPDGVQFGDIIDDANLTYAAGETVTVKFYGANPRHNMKVVVIIVAFMQNILRGDTTLGSRTQKHLVSSHCSESPNSNVPFANNC